LSQPIPSKSSLGLNKNKSPDPIEKRKKTDNISPSNNKRNGGTGTGKSEIIYCHTTNDVSPSIPIEEEDTFKSKRTVKIVNFNFQDHIDCTSSQNNKSILNKPNKQSSVNTIPIHNQQFTPVTLVNNSSVNIPNNNINSQSNSQNNTQNTTNVYQGTPKTTLLDQNKDILRNINLSTTQNQNISVKTQTQNTQNPLNLQNTQNFQNIQNTQITQNTQNTQNSQSTQNTQNSSQLSQSTPNTSLSLSQSQQNTQPPLQSKKSNTQVFQMDKVNHNKYFVEQIGKSISEEDLTKSNQDDRKLKQPMKSESGLVNNTNVVNMKPPQKRGI